MTTTLANPAPAGPAGLAPRGPAGPHPGSTNARPAPVWPVPVPDADLMDMAKAFILLYLEVEAGRRTRRQLEPLIHPRLAATLATVWVRPGNRGHLHQMSGARTAHDRFDAVAVVRRGPRYGAIAVGLQRVRGRWRVVEAARPEDGRLPAPEFWVGRGDLWNQEPDAFEGAAAAASIG